MSTGIETLRNYFSHYGTLSDAVIMRDKFTGRSRGFGFVLFDDPQSVDTVINEQHAIDGRNVEVKRAVPKEDIEECFENHHLSHAGSNDSESPSPSPSSSSAFRTKKLFVGGLPHSTSDAEFRTYFEQFGTITDAQVMTDRDTGRPRGFGFVSFASEDVVDTIMTGQQHEIGGKVVELKRAEPKRALQLAFSAKDKAGQTGDNHYRDDRQRGRLRGEWNIERDSAADFYAANDLPDMGYHPGRHEHHYDRSFRHTSGPGSGHTFNPNYPYGSGASNAGYHWDPQQSNHPQHFNLLQQRSNFSQLPNYSQQIYSAQSNHFPQQSHPNYLLLQNQPNHIPVAPQYQPNHPTSHQQSYPPEPHSNYSHHQHQQHFNDMTLTDDDNGGDNGGRSGYLYGAGGGSGGARGGRAYDTRSRTEHGGGGGGGGNSSGYSGSGQGAGHRRNGMSHIQHRHVNGGIGDRVGGGGGYEYSGHHRLSDGYGPSSRGNGSSHHHNQRASRSYHPYKIES